MSKALNIGMIGYGFMGRAHSNAYRKVANFFDLDRTPVLKAACARDEERAKVREFSSGDIAGLGRSAVRREVGPEGV